MKNKFLLLTWLLAVPLLWAGCNWFGNDDDEITIKPIDWETEETLPEMTTTGENTFGCLVNGEVWRPKGGPYFGLDAQLSFSYHEPSGGFYLRARKRELNDSFELEQTITISSVFHTQSDSSTVRQAHFFDDAICESGDVLNPMYADTSLGFEFQIIYLDESQNIISGIFDFEFVKENCQDTIRVTDGRFDIKYAN
ncbi:MAG: hypothetical protein RIC19_13100 [Phaeodactylibacter sp.]|uniref:hypothetical protein n=1 Tax=Phaeodactylibacter sp. TaxID=1940289 RepID=UPI0032EC39DD